jgi:PQQ-dependent dehydrogenase (methanol/ethanol family)
MDHMTSKHMLKGTVAAMCLAGIVGWAHAAPVSDKMLAQEAGNSWLHTNGNWAGHRYSTLTQISKSNAKDLKVAWAVSVGGKTDAMATPLYHDGLLYFPQDNKVFAISADDGSIAWKYEHTLPEDWGGYNVPFFTGKHRGLAIYGDHVYFLSNDNQLHALHYKTGKAKFVKDYQADGFPYPKDFAKAQDSNGYVSTVGPLAVPGAILLPLNATDTGGLPGYVIAANPQNGNMMWKANMIPGPGEPGYETWPPGSYEYGGAGPWIVGSYDPDLKMYFTGTANAYEWNPKNRGGGEMDNVGAASIVAVNTTNGKVAWRYVGVPGDPWDYDIPSTPLVINIDGRKTIVQPNKTGYIHHLDARTGKFLKADLFVDKINWITGYDRNGRPMGQIPLPQEGGDPVEVWPSLLGGVNMYPAAYNPKNGLIYLPATEAGMMYGFEDIKVIANVRHFGAYQEFIWEDEIDKAVNVKTGKEIWRDRQVGKPGYAGGMLTTAGDITVYTTQGGNFKVVDANTGKELYSLNLRTAAKSGPLTFMHKGKQMIVQALGGQAQFGRDDILKTEFGHVIVAFSR